jgi:hypothetical protein
MEFQEYAVDQDLKDQTLSGSRLTYDKETCTFIPSLELYSNISRPDLFIFNMPIFHS